MCEFASKISLIIHKILIFIKNQTLLTFYMMNNFPKQTLGAPFNTNQNGILSLSLLLAPILICANFFLYLETQRGECNSTLDELSCFLKILPIYVNFFYLNANINMYKFKKKLILDNIYGSTSLGITLFRS